MLETGCHGNVQVRPASVVDNWLTQVLCYLYWRTGIHSHVISISRVLAYFRSKSRTTNVA